VKTITLIYWKEKTFKKNALNAEASGMTESIESTGCVLYQALNIIIVIAAIPDS
jgi:hypothetical protein